VSASIQQKDDARRFDNYTGVWYLMASKPLTVGRTMMKGKEGTWTSNEGDLTANTHTDNHTVHTFEWLIRALWVVGGGLSLEHARQSWRLNLSPKTPKNCWDANSYAYESDTPQNSQRRDVHTHTHTHTHRQHFTIKATFIVDEITLINWQALFWNISI
jgi:hypothetical protein